jgi:hypothetical protein
MATPHCDEFGTAVEQIRLNYCPLLIVWIFVKRKKYFGVCVVIELSPFV